MTLGEAPSPPHEPAEPLVRYRLDVHYDGTHYHGWQIQPEVPTVQGALESVLTQIESGVRRPVVGSGRTDRGVHATGQVASVDLSPRWTPDRLHSALNALLPRDVWVSSVARVAPDFHPRYDAIDRTYRYEVGLGSESHSPFRRPWCWPLREAPDVDLLRSASDTVVGEHSFRAFAKAGQPERGEVCTVFQATWSQHDTGLRWTVTANRYLHHMVRYLVGTMVDIGLGRRDADEMPQLLTSVSGLTTSKPAPPEGLFLHRVRYPGDEPGAGSDHTRSDQTRSDHTDAHPVEPNPSPTTPLE